MKPFKVITDPESIKLVGDPTRRRVIYLLRARELTISQIADELEISPQAIYRHIRKLLEAEMVEIARQDRIGNFVESYYRATAEVFEYVHGEAKSPEYAEVRLSDALQSLTKLGIRVTASKTQVQKLLETHRKIRALGMRQEFMDNINKLKSLDTSGKQETLNVARLITMTNTEFEEWLHLFKEFRTALQEMRRTPRPAKHLEHQMG